MGDMGLFTRVYLIDAQWDFSITRKNLLRFIMLGMRKNGCQVNQKTFYYAHLTLNLRYDNEIQAQKLIEMNVFGEYGCLLLNLLSLFFIQNTT